jgi:electron transfer flavoprotein beta subunit
MNILVCVKRIPDVGAKILLADDSRTIVTKNLGFVISPHEECAVELAVQLTETHGGTSTVLTLGVPDSEAQLRDCLARGMTEGILIETGGEEWDAEQTAKAVADMVAGKSFDLLLFGQESGDSSYAQVGIRVAQALGLPCVSGVKEFSLEGGKAIAGGEAKGGKETYEVALPAVFTIKDGLNVPRHPSLRGTMVAKKKRVEVRKLAASPSRMELVRFRTPPEQNKQVEMLGTGPGAAEKVVELILKLR